MEWRFIVPNADRPQEFFWQTQYNKADLRISAEYISEDQAILKATIHQFDELEHKTILTYYRRKVCKGIPVGDMFIEAVDKTMKKMQSDLVKIIYEDGFAVINV